MAKRTKESYRKDKRYETKKDYRPKGTKEGVRKENAVISAKDVVDHGFNNDPNWYFTNPEVAKQAGELSFQSFLGVPGTIGGYTMPTIMTIGMNPSPGNTYPGARFAQNRRSGFNMSMTKLFNRLSMKSGRNMAYAPQDVGAAVLGIGELLSMVSYMRRLFGVVKWWNVRNRMVPLQIVKAMGIDPDDFMAHFSDYRMRANSLILACNQIPILTNCGYLRKCASMYDNIYNDVDAGMSQYYIYVPYSTWILDETSDSRGTVLKTTPVVTAALGNHAATVRTFGAFLDDIFQPMVDKLLTSSTMNLVYADILNLNKTEDLQLASLDIISEDYAVVPVHDPMTLKQIHNSVAMGSASCGSETTRLTKDNDVVPDPDNNAVKYSPGFLVPQRNYGSTDPTDELGDLRIIDTDTSDPDLAEKIEITRYVSSHTNSFETVGGHRFNRMSPVPDHYVVEFTIYTDQVADSTNTFTFTSDFEKSDGPSLSALAELSQFDWHPIIYHYTDITSGGPWMVDAIWADLNSFTIVNWRYIERLNSIIYMDLFDFR